MKYIISGIAVILLTIGIIFAQISIYPRFGDIEIEPTNCTMVGVELKSSTCLHTSCFRGKCTAITIPCDKRYGVFEIPNIGLLEFALDDTDEYTTGTSYTCYRDVLSDTVSLTEYSYTNLKVLYYCIISIAPTVIAIIIGYNVLRHHIG
jgi:hypothetical protein